MTQRTLTNRRSGDSLVTTMSNSEAALKLSKLSQGSDREHWLWYWIHKFVIEAETNPADLGDALDRVSYLFLFAIGNGLQRPRIRARYKTRRYQLYLSRRGTLCFKVAELVDGTERDFGADKYMGCINEGRFLVYKERPMQPIDNEFLDQLRGDTVKFLAECSKDLGTCCYCNLPLDDPRSKTAGYGRKCAKNWGLPWGDGVDFDTAPNFMRWLMLDEDLQFSMKELRADPHCNAKWEALADYCEDNGLRRVNHPDRHVVLPR